MKNFVFAALVFVMAACGPKFDKEITLEDIKENINYLASDSLKGRKSGEEGDLLAAQFIAAKFEAAGLQLLYDGGFQEFNLVTSAEIADGNQLQVNGTEYEVEKDFLPYAFSANTTVAAEIFSVG